jgi:hypothetical protein
MMPTLITRLASTTPGLLQAHKVSFVMPIAAAGRCRALALLTVDTFSRRNGRFAAAHFTTGAAEEELWWPGSATDKVRY